MSFTRYHDDPVRIKKQLQESIYAGFYQLNTPGQGLDLPYISDPHCRLQKWGGNLQDNTINLESNLRGMMRKTTKTDVIENSHKKFNMSESQNSLKYRIEEPYVEESRASHPAWIHRSQTQSRWDLLTSDPQKNVEIPFVSNVHSRILEKDKARKL